MKITQISRLLPALTFACVMGVAPLAMAQTAASGSMASMNMAAPAHTAKSARLPKADLFKTVADATAHCPGGTVVWTAGARSKSFHLASSKYYGKTKHGAYVCEADATSFGYHQAKN
jgi:hypothetical protein